MNLVGYRKFIVTLLAQAYITGLCAFGLLSGGDALAAILAVTGAFVALNALQKSMVKNAE